MHGRNKCPMTKSECRIQSIITMANATHLVPSRFGRSPIPGSQIDDLVYFLKAVDTSGNFVEADVVKVTVKDLIPPVLVSDLTANTVGTGGELELKVKAVDNIGMKRVICTWSPCETTVSARNGSDRCSMFSTLSKPIVERARLLY